jgi:hypothetical protein
MIPCGLQAGYQYTTLAINQKTTKRRSNMDFPKSRVFVQMWTSLFADAVWTICELFLIDDYRMIQTQRCDWIHTELEFGSPPDHIWGTDLKRPGKTKLTIHFLEWMNEWRNPTSTLPMMSCLGANASLYKWGAAETFGLVSFIKTVPWIIRFNNRRKCARRVSRLAISCEEGGKSLHNGAKQENIATLFYISLFNMPLGRYRKMGYAGLSKPWRYTGGSKGRDPFILHLGTR